MGLMFFLQQNYIEKNIINAYKRTKNKIKHKNKLELFDSYNTLGVTNSFPVSYLSLLSCFSPFLKFNFKLSFCFPISHISF
jgi:type II secretory pathway component PulC